MASPDPLSLDYVLGLTPTTLAALAPAPSGAQRIAYATGNVGVLFDSETKAQTLLRGHVRFRARAFVVRRRTPGRASPRAPPPLRSGSRSRRRCRRPTARSS